MKFKYWLVLLLRIYISIALIALLVLPYSVVFVPLDNNAQWEYLFVWEDEILLMMFVPFFLLWPWYLLQNKKWQIIVLSLLSFFYFGNSLGSLAMPIQDFVPSAGVVLAGKPVPLPGAYLFFYPEEK